MTRVMTTTAVAIHCPDESPVFGTETIHVSLEDLGAGPFITIKQMNDEVEPGTVWLDFKDFDQLVEAVKMLKNQPSIVSQD